MAGAGWQALGAEIPAHDSKTREVARALPRKEQSEQWGPCKSILTGGGPPACRWRRQLPAGTVSTADGRCRWLGLATPDLDHTVLMGGHGNPSRPGLRWEGP